MPRLLRVSDRNKIPPPPMVLRDVGIAEGAYLSIEHRFSQSPNSHANITSATLGRMPPSDGL